MFVVTILALVAATFGDPQAPPARFLNAHGTTLIVCEAAATLAVGLLAMAVDRRQTLRQTRRSKRAGEHGRRSDGPADHIAPDGSEHSGGPAAQDDLRAQGRSGGSRIVPPRLL